jgi:hypothetical protein
VGSVAKASQRSPSFEAWDRGGHAFPKRVLPVSGVLHNSLHKIRTRDINEENTRIPERNIEDVIAVSYHSTPGDRRADDHLREGVPVAAPGHMRLRQRTIFSAPCSTNAAI